MMEIIVSISLQIKFNRILNMEEYFVFDVEGKFTGEVLTTTEEESPLFDSLKECNGTNIMDGFPASPIVGIVHYNIQ